MTINELCKRKADETKRYYEFCLKNQQLDHINKPLIKQMMRGYMNLLQYTDNTFQSPINSRTFLEIMDYIESEK